MRSSNLLLYSATSFYTLNLLLVMTKVNRLLGNSVLRESIKLMRLPLLILLVLVSILYILALYDFKSVQQKQDYKSINNLIYSLYIGLVGIGFSIFGSDMIAFCFHFTALFCMLLGYNSMRRSSTLPDPAVHGSQKLWIGATLALGGLFLSMIPTVGWALSLVPYFISLCYTYHGWIEIRDKSIE